MSLSPAQLAELASLSPWQRSISPAQEKLLELLAEADVLWPNQNVMWALRRRRLAWRTTAGRLAISPAGRALLKKIQEDRQPAPGSAVHQAEPPRGPSPSAQDPGPGQAPPRQGQRGRDGRQP